MAPAAQLAYDYSNLLSVRDKVVLVTGASSGIGRHFALFLASQGAKIVVAARRQDKLQELVNEIEQAGGQAASVSLDVAEGQEKIAESVDRAIAAYGRVDVLVNNAGVYAGSSLLTDTDADFDKVFGVNVRGLYFTAQVVAKHMLAQGIPGRIINVSSVAASDIVLPGMGIYSASKAAVLQLTRVLAVELAPKGINVNSISPGAFPSEMSVDLLAHENSKKAQRGVPVGRWGETETDMMGALLLLASENASRYIVGVNIVVDGGHSLYTFNMTNPTAIFE